MLPSGVELPGITRGQQRECMLENLSYAAPLAAEAGVLFTIEVLNPVDNPGYFLTSRREAIEIVKELNHPHVRYQLDTYHVQMMEGNWLRPSNRMSLGSAISSLQITRVGTSQAPVKLISSSYRLLLKNQAYKGYIGLEYKPLAAGVDALQWALPVE